MTVQIRSEQQVEAVAATQRAPVNCNITCCLRGGAGEAAIVKTMMNSAGEA